MTQEELNKSLADSNAINVFSMVLLTELFHLSKSALFEVLTCLSRYDSFNTFLKDCKRYSLKEMCPVLYDILSMENSKVEEDSL